MRKCGITCIPAQYTVLLERGYANGVYPKGSFKTVFRYYLEIRQSHAIDEDLSRPETNL